MRIEPWAGRDVCVSLLGVQNFVCVWRVISTGTQLGVVHCNRRGMAGKIRLVKHPSSFRLSQLTYASMSARPGLRHRRTRYHSGQMTAV